MLLDYEKEPEKVNFRDEQYLKKTADRMPDIGKKVRALACTLILLQTLLLSYWHPKKARQRLTR